MAVLVSLMVFTTLVHIHYVSNVIRQMCDYLKIEAFRIKNIYTESRLVSFSRAAVTPYIGDKPRSYLLFRKCVHRMKF